MFPPKNYFHCDIQQEHPLLLVFPLQWAKLQLPLIAVYSLKNPVGLSVEVGVATALCEIRASDKREESVETTEALLAF